MAKTYIELMREISREELYRGLLAFGMFTDKLPPIFSAVDFFDYCEVNNVSFPNAPRQLIQYESMRNINVPRLMAIPNPFAYQRLCQCLADNWDELCDHFEEQTTGNTYKVSRVHIRKLPDIDTLFSSEDYGAFTTSMEYKENLLDLNYQDWRIDGSPEQDILIGKRWFVRTDIATCFPSIYTHSIPWALVGKDISKQNRSSSVWYNEIDRRSQNTKDGETHGIPIGPHSSNLIAEIILTAVDRLLCPKWEYIRKIDDYTCYVKSREEAELFLTELSEALRHFDLTLNYKKTTIAELPVAVVNHWSRQMENIAHYERKGKIDYKSVQSYLDSAVELMESNGNDAAILKYAIKVLSNQDMTDNAKEYCVKMTLHLAVIYPYLVPLLDRYVFECFTVESNTIENFTQVVLENSLRLKNYETASFCVYFALKYNFKLLDITVDCGIASNNCLFMVFVYLYAKKYFNIADKTKLKNHAKLLSQDDVEFDRNWLFVYECLSINDLKNDWKPLKRNKISFIKFS